MYRSAAPTPSPARTGGSPRPAAHAAETSRSERRSPPFRPAVLVPLAVFLTVTAVSLAALGPGSGTPGGWALSTVLLAPSVVVGVLLGVRVPHSPVGPALAWVGVCPAVVLTVERWAGTVAAPDPWPGAAAANLVVAPQAIWPLHFVGLLALLLVYPDGRLPGRGWRVVAVAVGIVPVLLAAQLALNPGNYATEGGPVPGPPPVPLSDGVWTVLTALTFAAFAGLLAVAAASVVVRYRRGDEVTRLRVRWLALVAVAVPALLVLTWVAAALGLPVETGSLTLLCLLLLGIPAAVAIAVLRYELFDVDRLLGEGAAWLLTTLVSAGVFAGVVAVLTPLVRSLADVPATADGGSGIDIGVSSAAFVAALVLLPVHRGLTRAIGRLLDRERWVVLRRVEEFTEQVRDGSAEPEAVEQVLRVAIGDPGARLLLRRPGTDQFVDLSDRPIRSIAGDAVVPLREGDDEVGMLTLSSASARRLRRARDVLVRARLPIEVSRLRLELRRALADVSASRTRLAQAAEQERRRLERDLHDGAQQSIVAVGMTVRSVQRDLDPASAAWADLDRAVGTLEATIAELRRLAHGLRPAGLDDGLARALARLAADCPVPVTVDCRGSGPVHSTGDAWADLDPLTVETVWFVVAEALTNVLRHARADRAAVMVDRTGSGVTVIVTDDGIGGAREGFGLRSLRDRVGAAGGELTVDSAPGQGTTVRAVVPCAS
ncbi:hypothetical protein FDO65_02540 [Nakamurella flava]|uniref:histidine kinase n=1 Tax=Nakamurella flava TaxID=2576308 RepID=A0A4V6CS85_9ACTN|nr:histidine kinase [Nakamurella flava]TKV60595.1 hypothetical protein FDO65_02540 [Nakamurella flava]